MDGPRHPQGWLNPRPISTARLRPSLTLHLLPIYHLFLVGPYSLDGMGELILRWASHLDAFSGYPLPTWLPGVGPWQDHRYTSGRFVPVLSY